MKKFLRYIALSLALLTALLCSSGCSRANAEGAEEAAERNAAEEEARIREEEAAREEKRETLAAPIRTSFAAVGSVVSAAAEGYQPPLLTEDGALLLTYDELVARLADPQTEADMQAWYGNTLFIGDSRTVGMAQYSGITGADFFALTGMSVFDAFKGKVKLDQNAPDGTEVDLQTLLTEKKYDKIYLMLGINELGYSLPNIEKKYEDVTVRIKTLQPQAQLWLQANMHVSQGRSDKDPTFNNITINNLNTAIKGIAQRQETGWLDVNPVFDDANGHLDMGYTFDHTHLVGKYYKYWGLWIYLQSIHLGV